MLAWVHIYSLVMQIFIMGIHILVRQHLCAEKQPVVTHPCLNFNRALAKPPLKSGHGWEIESHKKHGRDHYFDGLVQEKRISITNPLELCLSCTNPSICPCSNFSWFLPVIQGPSSPVWRCAHIAVGMLESTYAGLVDGNSNSTLPPTEI